MKEESNITHGMEREIRHFAPSIFGESDVEAALTEHYHSEGYTGGLAVYLEGQLNIIKYQLEKRTFQSPL